MLPAAPGSAGKRSTSFTLNERSLTMTTTVSGTFTAGPPGSSGACPGPYTGKVTFKDGTSTWFTPPTGSTNCTITDISGFALPYASKVEAVESGTLRQSCASNSVSFALTAGKKY